jgi:hypothetical protein
MGLFYKKGVHAVNNVKDTILFKRKVPKGTKIKLFHILSGDCTIEKVTARFYKGQELNFHVKPYLLHASGMRENLVGFPNVLDSGAVQEMEEYLAGDDDLFPFSISVPAERDERIVVEVENKTDAVNGFDYDLVIWFDVDYMMGKNRAVN